MKLLVVHADDLGIDPSVTAGAIRAWRDGILTSASVLPSGPDWEDSSEALRAAPGLDLGVHLSVCEGHSVLPRSEVPSLVDADGRFPSSLATVLRRGLLGRIRADELRAEWGAQIERALQAGHRISHLDGHKHLHLFPPFARIALELRREYGIPAFRLALESGPGPRRTMRRGLALLSRRLRDGLESEDALVCDRTLGIACAGHCDADHLDRLLDSVSEGITELIVHPGEPSPQRRTRMRGHGLSWEENYRFDDELDALVRPGLGDRLQRSGLHLTSWADIAQSRGLF